jgi:hypothetical protein
MPRFSLRTLMVVTALAPVVVATLWWERNLLAVSAILSAGYFLGVALNSIHIRLSN